MVTVSLVKASTPDERWQQLLAMYGRFARRPLTLNQKVYKSAGAANFHNRDIAWLLYSYWKSPFPAMLFLRRCAILHRQSKAIASTLS